MRVAATSPSAARTEITELLKDGGATVVPLPVFEIAGPSSWTALDGALERLEEFAWILFTSRNGVAAFLERAGDRPLPEALKVAAVGAPPHVMARPQISRSTWFPAPFHGSPSGGRAGRPDGAV